MSSDVGALVRTAMERLAAGDTDGLLSLCADDAEFFIGGKTRISADHDMDGFRRVVPELAVRSGALRRDLIDVAVADDRSWADAIVHDYVTRDGTTYDYHAVFEWQLKDAKFAYLFVYVHEFDAFADAWA